MIFDKMENAKDYFEEYPQMKLVYEFSKKQMKKNLPTVLMK